MEKKIFLKIFPKNVKLELLPKTNENYKICKKK